MRRTVPLRHEGVNVSNEGRRTGCCGVHRASTSSQKINQPRRHRDTEILCVFVSLWLILSVLSAPSVSITRTNSWMLCSMHPRLARELLHQFADDTLRVAEKH